MENKNKQFEEFVDKKRLVKICGQDYLLKELSLAQKIKVIGCIAEQIGDITKNILIRKDGKGGVKIEIPENLNLADLNIETILISSINALPKILALSIPDFKDWDTLPESDTREALLSAMEINDFAGFIANFMSLAGSAIRLQKH